MDELVVIDTDCGVDDAMALLLLLNSRCNVLGITCCHGNTALENVVKNVKRVLTLCNRKEVPVYKGCNTSLLRRPTREETAYHCADGFGGCSGMFPTGDIPHSDVPAPAALSQMSLGHPGQVTLLAIGPLTNLALAHRLDPGFSRRLKRLVIMGGNYKSQGNTTELSEFNFHFDPEAADMVLGEFECPITMVPWETSAEFGFTYDHYDRMCAVQTSKAEFYRKATVLLTERCRARNKTLCTDCDLLAVVAALYPDCMASTLDSPVAVECEGRWGRGMAVLLNHYKSLPDHGRREVRIVTGFDRQRLDQLRLAALQDGPVEL